MWNDKYDGRLKAYAGGLRIGQASLKYCWGGNFTPPLRTFISENREKLSGKKLSLALCYMGGGAQKAEKKLKAFLGIEAFEAVLTLVDPLKKKKDEDLEKIHAFCEKIR